MNPPTPCPVMLLDEQFRAAIAVRNGVLAEDPEHEARLAEQERDRERFREELRQRWAVLRPLIDAIDAIDASGEVDRIAVLVRDLVGRHADPRVTVDVAIAVMERLADRVTA